MKTKEIAPVRASPADWDALRQSIPSDYDGHTHFGRMLPAERLAWLESAVQFMAEVDGKLRPSPVAHKNAPKEAHG
jgi:hypothetical protein